MEEMPDVAFSSISCNDEGKMKVMSDKKMRREEGCWQDVRCLQMSCQLGDFLKTCQINVLYAEGDEA